MLMSASPSSVLHRGSESPAPYANERGPVPRTTLQLPRAPPLMLMSASPFGVPHRGPESPAPYANT